MSSSHLFLGLLTALLALQPLLRPGFHLLLFLTILSLAEKRSSLPISISSLCVTNPARDIGCPHFSSASLVLLFRYSIQSSSISVVSMSSSVSPMKETSLSWSQSVFELIPSSVSPSEFLLHSSFSSAFSSFVGSSSFCVFFLHCFFQRVDLISFVDVFIFREGPFPEAYVSVGVMTMLNK